ncbi:MAG TPA: molybdopterin cofactor-binding domain-containing protein [Ramlibacter sp.]|uniref:xanthine dehydrogenase family protein molybdopterin-binding subunit n=1 Tax=Ramlibacter sp. TaxID=1917967 RepID=UPI002ED613BA
MQDEGFLSLQRRELLQAAGALVVSALAPASALAQASASATSKPPLAPEELDSWVAILPDGRVNAYYGKVDLGQGLEVAIAQIVAEELDVAVDRVQVVMGDSATSINQGGASSALGIQAGARPLRNAAAEARRLLLEMASAQLGVPVAGLSVSDGVVSVRADPARQVRYTELIGGRYFHSKVEWNKRKGNQLNVTGKAKPKSPSEYKIVGQPLPRRDVAWKVFGNGTYVSDIRVPGMLHARVIRPTRAGAVPQQVDAGSIARIRGARVVQEKNFLAVVADHEWDAVRAARALKMQWSAVPQPFPGHDGVHAHLRKATVEKREDEVKKGDIAPAFAGAARVVEAEYEWPFQSHASMGPGCAIVDAKPGEARLWTGTQKPHYARDGVAKMLGLPPKKVHATWVLGPGSYGRNDAGDAAIDAALLSKLTGRPVRVQYMRHDATGWDPKAPASVHRARAALDASGQVVGYEFVSRGFSRANIESNESDPSHSLAGMELGLPLKPEANFGVPAESYGFAGKLLGWETVPALLERGSPLRTSHMRDPVGLQIQFASEQFIDELAHAAGEDPVAFRLKYLTAPRDREVVKAAAEKAGWQARPAQRARTGDVLSGRGIAYAQRAGTVVAVVAEVEVDRRSGRVWARRMTVAHDCGLVVNPAGLKQTIECGLVQGISRTLLEEVRFDREQVTSVDWLTYPILDIKDAPETIDVVLLDRIDVAPTGAGEATPRVVPAAIANAFFDATGVRLRRAPLTPERVKAALARLSA